MSSPKKKTEVRIHGVPETLVETEDVPGRRHEVRLYSIKHESRLIVKRVVNGDALVSNDDSIDARRTDDRRFPIDGTVADPKVLQGSEPLRLGGLQAVAIILPADSTRFDPVQHLVQEDLLQDHLFERFRLIASQRSWQETLHPEQSRSDPLVRDEEGVVMIRGTEENAMACSRGTPATRR